MWVYMSAWVWMLVFKCMYVCIKVCVCVYPYVVCVCARMYVRVSSCVWLRVAAIWTRYRIFGFVLVMNPIRWQFKGRSMRWSVDQYMFVQWRPDGDSVPKPRHFMWVFVIVHFLIYHCRYRLHINVIISCDFLLYFINLITCITSWDISERLLYLCARFELVSIENHLEGGWIGDIANLWTQCGI